MKLGVPVLANYEGLARLIDSAERGSLIPSSYIVIDNGGKIFDEFPDALDETRIDVVSPIENLGVASSWNLMLEGGEPIIIANDDVILGRVQFEEMAKDLERHPFVGNGWCLFGQTPECTARVGYYDENFWPAYCLTPDTPVLTADLEWVQIGDVKPGMCLVGVDEYGSGGGSRKYKKAIVTSVSRRRARTLRIRMADGRVTVCSTDHKWLTRRKPPCALQYKWVMASDLRPGCRINTPLDVWGPNTTYDGGWLAGILDGEGCLHISPRLRGVTFSQKPGVVLTRAKKLLKDMRIPFTHRVASNGSVVVVEICVRRYVMRVLGELRPVRLLQTRVWDGTHLRSRSDPAHAKFRKHKNDLLIDKIEMCGTREVVSIETTAKTFIANGMVSHNCEDSDYDVRLHRAGIPRHWSCSEPVEHAGCWTTANLLGRPHWLMDRVGQCQRYFVEKWGAQPSDTFRGYYDEAFNGQPPADWSLRR